MAKEITLKMIRKMELRFPKKRRPPANDPAWEEPLLEAQKQLEQAKKRVAGLKRVIRNWRKLRDSGMLWPGGMRANAQHGRGIQRKRRSQTQKPQTLEVLKIP